MEESGRQLVARIDTGKGTAMEPAGSVLIYRQEGHSGIEVVTTSRDNGDCSLMLSPEEARLVADCILGLCAKEM